MRRFNFREWGRRTGIIACLMLVAGTVLATPGAGIRAGNWRVSPFADLSVGYDNNAELAAGDVLTLQPDGSYEVQDTKEDDYFSQYTIGVGMSRALESEWDLRLRGWYENRLYKDQTDSDYDSVSAEAFTRYWPTSDAYEFSLGAKVREAQDVERVPSSASSTMPGNIPLPYLEERDDRLKRTTLDGYTGIEFRPRERTTFGLNGSASTVNYDDERLFDYWNWTVSGDAGYRYTDKTFVFAEGEYEVVQGDSITGDVPVYTLRVGFKTKPRVKVDYRISLGVKTYEYWTDATGDEQKRKWDPDFDGLLNWRYSERLSFFGKAWTDVGTAIQEEAPEDIRRTYAAQIGTDYAFARRLSAMGAFSYRLDAFDYTIHYGNDLEQDNSELWQVMGRLTLSPQVDTFWKMFAEISYEEGDNDLDDYDQLLIWLGASVWY